MGRDEKNQRAIDEQALEEAYRALWWGDAEPVSGEDLREATELMFGAGASRPAPTSGEVDDWAHMLCG